MIRKTLPQVEYLDVLPEDYKPSDVSATHDDSPNNLSLIDYDVSKIFSDKFWFYFESADIDYLLYSDSNMNGLYEVSNFNPELFKDALRQNVSFHEAVML